MDLERDFRKFLEITGGDSVAAAILAHAATIERLAANEHAAPKPLSVQDVATRLAVAPGKIRSWIRDGVLKASNLADNNRPRFVIEEADLAAFLQLRRVEPKTQSVGNRRKPVRRGDDRY